VIQIPAHPWLTLDACWLFWRCTSIQTAEVVLIVVNYWLYQWF